MILNYSTATNSALINELIDLKIIIIIICFDNGFITMINF